MTNDNRDVDRKIAEWMGWTWTVFDDGDFVVTRPSRGDFLWDFLFDNSTPGPTEDANLCREVLAEVEKRGLANDWLIALEEILGVWGWNRAESFKLVTASPLDQMRALVRVIKGVK